MTISRELIEKRLVGLNEAKTALVKSGNDATMIDNLIKKEAQKLSAFVSSDEKKNESEPVAAQPQIVESEPILAQCADSNIVIIDNRDNGIDNVDMEKIEKKKFELIINSEDFAKIKMNVYWLLKYWYWRVNKNDLHRQIKREQLQQYCSEAEAFLKDHAPQQYIEPILTNDYRIRLKKGNTKENNLDDTYNLIFEEMVEKYDL